MTLSPELLLTAAAQRVRAVRPDLSAHLDLSSPRSLQAAKEEIAARDASDRQDEATVVAVIRGVRLTEWVPETCRFALSLAPEQAERWRRSFTRTLYLAGRPENLRERFRFAHVAADGSAAWAGPATDAETAPLRRLLKTFSGRRNLTAWTPATVRIPPVGSPGPRHRTRPAVHRDLYLATDGLTVAGALVQLSHLLAEAVIDGLIAPGDRLTLRSVPQLPGASAAYAALRIDTDAHHPPALRAYAGLTEEI
ncbi:DUF6182 family protein [Streptomyces sp. NPDC057616]|uniref:DUF6182 family protein n=1 Tax=Streptomyces sp. NPDC057616 TaxID=3346183 RepID=UPI0036C96E9F